MGGTSRQALFVLAVVAGCSEAPTKPSTPAAIGVDIQPRAEPSPLPSPTMPPRPRPVTLYGLHADKTAVADLTPLAPHEQLTFLSLSSTQVADLSPIRGLSKIETLIISGLPVSDLAPIDGWKSLRTLWLEGTQLSPQQIKTFHRRNPGVFIDGRNFAGQSQLQLAHHGDNGCTPRPWAISSSAST